MNDEEIKKYYKGLVPHPSSTEMKLIRKELEVIKDTLTILMKRRPDQTCRIRFKQILDELRRIK